MEEQRSKLANRLVVKHYWQETLHNWNTTIPGLVLTGVGTIFVFYLPPLVLARLLDKYSSSGIPEISEILAYIIAFAGFWLIGEMIWRLALFLLIKGEVRGARNLYVSAVNELIDKDLAFYHNNFAGSLTKKTSAYSRSYIEVIDTFLFNVSPNIIPMIFIAFVLWRFSPLLVLVLFGMMALVIAGLIPLIKQRKKLVVERETASNKVSGYVSDIYTNIDAIHAFGSENFERKLHKQNVEDLAQKMKKS